MKFGAHTSTKEPFSDAIIRAEEQKCECMQIFVNAPQRWNPIEIPKDELEKFKVLNLHAKINPIIIHSIYLINLASDNPFFYEASIKSLINDMKKAEAISALGVNFHVGSTKGKNISEVMDKIVAAIKKILKETDNQRFLILENSAGAGNIIGDKFSEIGKIIKAVDSDRLKVTLDTAHAFASGYDLSTMEGLNKTISEFNKEIGIERLVCLHLNDSAIPLGGLRDRHADIGEGYIGLEGFKNIINHPKLKKLPGILETPSLKGKGEIDNLKILRSLVLQ